MICEQCQHTNTRTFDKVQPQLHPIKVQTWYHVGIDLIGQTESGNQYVLTLCDYCTKWVEAVGLKTKHATGVALTLFKALGGNH